MPDRTSDTGGASLEVRTSKFSIVGIVVVFGCVAAWYLMQPGNWKVLMKPKELIIILGAAIGTVLIGNPLHILTKSGSGFAGAFGGSAFSKGGAGQCAVRGLGPIRYPAPRTV